MDHVKHAVYGERVQQHRFEVCDTLQLLRPASAPNAIKYELMLDLDFLGGYDEQVTSQCCHSIS